MGRGLSMVLGSLVVVATLLWQLLTKIAVQKRMALLLIAAFVLLTVVNILWLATVGIGARATPPSPATEILLALSYALLFVAAAMGTLPNLRRDSGGVLDAATVGIGVALALWLLVVDPTLNANGFHTARSLYILTVMTILSAIAGVVLHVGTQSARDHADVEVLIYFGLAIALAVFGNILRTLVTDSHTGAALWWTGATWTLAYAIVWAAIAHERSTSAVKPPTLKRSRLSSARVLSLTVAVSLAPAIALGRSIAEQRVQWEALMVALIVMLALVMTRVNQLAKAHRRTEDRLKHLAHKDELTGIANRRAAGDFLETLVTRVADAASTGAVVCFIDLNDFKGINDTYGHHAGDAVLVEVAQRLSQSVRNGQDDVVARLGGDEFLMVMEGDPERIEPVVLRRGGKVFESPMRVNDTTIAVTAAIGTSTLRAGEQVSVDALLSHADHKMYEHKRQTNVTENQPT